MRTESGMIRLLVLTLGAMPVLAGMIRVAELVTLLAEIDLAAAGFGAAGFDVLHGPPMRRQHAGAEPGAILRTMQPKDLGQLDHQPFTMGGHS
jgi:hypothetical protein